MYGTFWGAKSFNRDISKWNVSSVANMHGMFRGAALFNSNIAEWDVSRVSNMYSMFMDAAAFNIDISKWNVSKVVTMDYMFWYHHKATSFKQKLCGDDWVHSKASKKFMVRDWRGSISSRVCHLTTTRQYVSRRPIPDRELIARTPISTPVKKRAIAITPRNEMMCPKCAAFQKSGRVSCCAPGGAWYTVSYTHLTLPTICSV